MNLLLPDSVHKEKSLYTYESKMAFFTRMACTVAGAELLLESGLMVRLAELKVFSAKPEAAAYHLEIAPRCLKIYRQILFPALRLCQALLSCLGSSNVSAVIQIKHFIKANEQIFRSILHPPSHESISSIAGLEEVSLLTGVLAKCGPLDEDSEGFLLIKQQMLTLVHHFDASDELIKKAVELIGEQHKNLVQKLLVQVAVNLHSFVRQVACVSNSKRLNCKIIFSPKVSEGSVSGRDVVLAGRPLNIGQVLRAVLSLCRQLVSSHSSLVDATDPKIKQDLSFNIKYLGSSIESTLWVVWKHVEYFSRCGNEALDIFGGKFSNFWKSTILNIS